MLGKHMLELDLLPEIPTLNEELFTCDRRYWDLFEETQHEIIWVVDDFLKEVNDAR